MPRGDRYGGIEPYTKGPRKTIDAMNGDQEILKDLAERVCNLEDEVDSESVLQTTKALQICVGGTAKLLNVVVVGDYYDPES